MTAKKTEQKIAIMSAWANGHTIEQQRVGPHGYWTEVKTPTWDWVAYDYRVKQAQMRPYTDDELAELVIDGTARTVRPKRRPAIRSVVIGVYPGNVTLVNSSGLIAVSADKLLADWEFTDGKPCGVLV